MKEIWKKIKGYEVYYMVSNLGNVKRVDTERILKPATQNKGYLYVNLSTNGIYKKFTIHRLVAHVFIENPENKPYVNHKNGIKTDNQVRVIKKYLRNKIYTQYEIAEIFNVSQGNITAIKTGRSWRHVK